MGLAVKLRVGVEVGVPHWLRKLICCTVLLPQVSVTRTHSLPWALAAG